MRDTRQGSRTRLALFRGLLLVSSLCVSLLFAELVLRLLNPQPASWLKIYRRHPVLPQYSLLPNVRAHVDTGETNWTIAIDENGFRFNPDLRKKPACNLLWLGDSYAFGHGLDYPDSFVGRVDSQLVDENVINASVPGYGPIQYRQTLEYLIGQGMEFDYLIVASYVGNDFHDTQWNKDKVVVDGIIGNRGDAKSYLKRNLHLYRLVSSLYHRVTPQKQPSDRKAVDQLALAEAWRQQFLTEASSSYETEMSRILELGRAQGSEVAFLILPTREAASAMAGEASEVVSGSDRRPMLPIEKATEIFDRIGARYFDLTSALAKNPTEEMFFQFDGHLTREGSSIVADAVLNEFSLRCDGTIRTRPNSNILNGSVFPRQVTGFP
jgi:hypothetical protein